MRFLRSAIISVIVVATFCDEFADARKPSRPSAAAVSRRPNPSAGRSRRGPSSRRRPVVEEEEEEFDEEEEEEEEEEVDSFGGFDEEEDEPPPRREPPSRSRRRSRGPAVPRDDYDSEWNDDAEEDQYDDFRRPPPRRSGGRPPQPGRGRPGGRRPPPGRRPGGGRGVVRYEKPQSTFSKSWSALRENLPDPSSVKNAVGSGLSSVKDVTTGLGSNLYREVKGLTSSELEQVMLKATRPDDTPVKGKHAERLVGVTYQISSRYDIYDAVLRKLWGKMAEKDWRTTIKALYILHRFSADGAPEHAAALKARLRELRRTRDPKRKDKFFNSKQLLAGTATPENAKFRAFMSRYAHYVILRAQCFGGLFDEIASEPKVDKKKKGVKAKPVTSTSLRKEHLEAAAMLLKAGLACQLKEGEECENTAIAVERVCSDLIGLSSAVAIAVNRALKNGLQDGVDASIVKKWCQLYSEELLPKTRAMVKKSTKKLDAFGLYLPSRMGTTIGPEILEMGLNLDEENAPDAAEEPKEDKVDDEEEEEEEEPEPEKEPEKADAETLEEDDDVDEYEYDDEEYYDEEDE